MTAGARLPEEEEYELARAGRRAGTAPGPAAGAPAPDAVGGVDPVTQEALRLIGLTFGLAMLVGIMLVVFSLLFFITGSELFLYGNFVVVVVAVIGVAYLMYERSKLTLRP